MSMVDVPTTDAGDAATSVDKALSLLEAFDHPGISLGVTELARRTKLPKATAHRLLATLEQHGMIERRGTQYALGKRLFELGNRTVLSRPRSFRIVAVPYLFELLDQTQETVHLATLDGIEALYLARIHKKQSLARSAIGQRKAAYCSAVGKALLAWSDESVVDLVIEKGLAPRTGYTISDPAQLRSELSAVRDLGLAFDREESKIGVACVGAPILSRAGRLLGAVSVCGPTSRFSPETHARKVLQAARTIGDLAE